MIVIDLITVYWPQTSRTTVGPLSLSTETVTGQSCLRLKDERWPAEEVLIPVSSDQATGEELALGAPALIN